ncbi:MAG: hypothetical protein RDU25_06295 [Patescibacteria group bacterium]|nr:hypothetical protein [Patescibacteria group bacterium]
MMRKIFQTMSVVVVSFLFVPGFAHALTISPPLVDKTMDPGQAEQGSVLLINESKQDQTFYASVQKFIPKGEEGQQEYLEESDNGGLPSWIFLDQKSITIAAGEKKEFKWSVNLPKNAEPGGHYATLFFSTNPDDAGGTAVGVGGKLGVLFLVNVNGNIKESANVESFSLVAETLDPSNPKEVSSINHLPAFFQLRVKNTGSVHINPNGQIDIYNMFGTKVTSVPVNPKNNKVLPNSIRRITSFWGDIGDEVPTSFLGNLKAEWSGFAVGRYTAKVDAKYGTQNQPLNAEVSFWVFPWRLALVALLLLLGLAVMIKVYNAMVIKSAMNRKTKI